MAFQEKILQNPFRLFVVLSILFHLFLMALLAVRWPKVGQTMSRTNPMFVRVIDPAELFKVPVEKETILPPKPKDIPKGDLAVPPPSAVAPRVSRPNQLRSPKPSVQPKAASKSIPSKLPELSEANPSISTPAPAPSPAPSPGTQPSETQSQETAPSESAAASTPQESLTPIPKQSVPGLPFTDQKELDKLAKVFTEKELPKRDAISINTDDLRYLTYMLGLKRRIEFIWQYPPAAVAAGIQGELLLSFTIRQDGQLADVALVRSSGHRILDDEAIQAVRSASPYAPLPESWHQDRITITGSFIYYGSARAIQ
jgi:protein TonB